MEKEIKCSICGNTFTSSAPRSPRYCSPACKREGRYLINRKWQEKNPSYMYKYMRGYRATKENDKL